IIHRPDFLVAATIAHKRDLRAGDAWQAAGQLANDLVGELVREDADLSVADIAAIDFSNHWSQGGISHIVQPSLNLEAIAACRELAESQKLRRRRRAGPGLEIHFRRSS